MKSLKIIFDLSNKYIILATPLILFILISSLYLVFSSNGALINLIISVTLFTLMTAAFIAGWFKMVAQTILQPNREDINSIIFEFPAGVGEYFLPSIGLLFNILLLSLVILTLFGFIGMEFIGNPDISPQAFSSAMESTAALKLFIESLTTEQLYKLNLWNFLLLGAMLLTYFLLMFHIPTIFLKTKNPFKAFIISIKDLFSRLFIKNIGIFILLATIYFAISILSAITMGNIILHFIITLLNFYFIVVASIGIFYYYYRNFVEAYLGKNIDTRV